MTNETFWIYFSAIVSWSIRFMGNAMTVLHQMASPRNSNYMIVLVYKYNNKLVSFQSAFWKKYHAIQVQVFKVYSCGKSTKWVRKEFLNSSINNWICIESKDIWKINRPSNHPPFWNFRDLSPLTPLEFPIPSMVQVWMFSGTTPYMYILLLPEADKMTTNSSTTIYEQATILSPVVWKCTVQQ